MLVLHYKHSWIRWNEICYSYVISYLCLTRDLQIIDLLFRTKRLDLSGFMCSLEPALLNKSKIWECFLKLKKFPWKISFTFQVYWFILTCHFMKKFRFTKVDDHCMMGSYIFFNHNIISFDIIVNDFLKVNMFYCWCNLI